MPSPTDDRRFLSIDIFKASFVSKEQKGVHFKDFFNSYSLRNGHDMNSYPLTAIHRDFMWIQGTRPENDWLNGSF